MTDTNPNAPTPAVLKKIKLIGILTGILAVVQGIILVIAALYAATAFPIETLLTPPYLIAYGVPLLVGLLTIAAFIYYNVGLRFPHKAFYSIFTGFMVLFLISGFHRTFTAPNVGSVAMLILAGVICFFLLSNREVDTWLKQRAIARKNQP